MLPGKMHEIVLRVLGEPEGDEDPVVLLRVGKGGEAPANLIGERRAEEDRSQQPNLLCLRMHPSTRRPISEEPGHFGSYSVQIDGYGADLLAVRIDVRARLPAWGIVPGTERDDEVRFCRCAGHPASPRRAPVLLSPRVEKHKPFLVLLMETLVPASDLGVERKERRERDRVTAERLLGVTRTLEDPAHAARSLVEDRRPAHAS